MENKFIPFDVERAKKGDPVITRDKREARIICFDRVGHTQLSIVALVFKSYKETGSADKEECYLYDIEGRLDGNTVNGGLPLDLFMKPVKKTYWVNIYKNELGFLVYYEYLKEIDSPNVLNKEFIGMYSIEIEE